MEMNNLPLFPDLAPRKQYGVILCDPPWAFRNGGNGAAKNHYATMTPAELAELPVSSLARPDSLLLLWATWSQLDVALGLVEAWGFQYITGMPWVKIQADATVIRPTYGVGQWVRGCSEPILIARRGKLKPPGTHYLGILSERMEHSRKPESLHQYAEGFPGPYLEMFARRSVPGWDVYGNEIEGSIELMRGRTA